MEFLIVFAGVTSILAFVLHGAEKHRVNAGGTPYPTALMAAASVIAPFGALMGMWLFANRHKEKMMAILTPVMLLIYVAGVYLLRGAIA